MLYHKILGGKPSIMSDAVGERLLNLCSQTFIAPVDVHYQLFITTKDYVARPDLVSQFLYNTPGYTDIICKLNNIQNPFELNEGQILVCPEGTDISKFYLTPEVDDEDDIYSDETDTGIPQPKQVNDKRSANDSVVNDKRFDIDKKNRVIVY